MYLQIHQDQECSACGAVNQYEYITRHGWPGMSQTFIKCTRCGHELELHTTTSNSTGGPVSYQIEPTDNKVKF